MFGNIYKKRLLATLRTKDVIFWAWIFPVILATLFYFTFTNLDVIGKLHEIPLGVVDNEAYRQDPPFQSALEAVTGENGNPLFKVSLLPHTDEADKALDMGDIDGYILVENGPTLVVSDDGLNQTIIKRFLDSYLQTKNSLDILLPQDPALQNLSLSDPQSAEHLVTLLEDTDYTEEISLTSTPPQRKSITIMPSWPWCVCMEDSRD